MRQRCWRQRWSDGDNRMAGLATSEGMGQSGLLSCRALRNGGPLGAHLSITVFLRVYSPSMRYSYGLPGPEARWQSVIWTVPAMV